MDETQPLPRDADLRPRLAAGLSKLSQALRSEARWRAAERGLSTTQGEILMYLQRHPGACLNDVAEALAVSGPTASDSIDALVRKQLVEKRRSPSQPRQLSLALTSRGQVEAERAGSWGEALVSALEALPREEQETWLPGLVRVLVHLQHRGVIPPVATCATCVHLRREGHSGAAARQHCAALDIALTPVDHPLDCSAHAPSPVQSTQV